MLYPIAIFSGNEQPAWGVEVPDIPGCFSAGDDLDDALRMAREAIEEHLELLAEAGEAIPKANTLSHHAANPDYAGCTWAVVEVDVIRRMGKLEELSITLPSSLVARIDAYVKAHPEYESRSGFLAEAALRALQV